MEKMNFKVAYTHLGLFHSDDIFSGALLTTLFYGIKIVRVSSVTPQQLHECIVFDIGGGEFDHHHEPKKRATGEVYSSFGLLYDRFGKALIQKIAPENHNDVDFIFDYVLENYVKKVDFIDNFGRQENELKEITLLRQMNPFYFEDKSKSDIYYYEAVKVATSFLHMWVRKAIAQKHNQIAKQEWDNSVARAKNGIVVLKNYLPYKSFDCTGVEFVVFPSQREGFNLMAESSNKIDINFAKTAIFVHQGRHLAVFKTKEEALRVANKIVEKII